MSPEITHQLERYVKYRIPMGGFLRAVLENDFMRAVRKADDYNRFALYDITEYMIANMPVESYGSVEAVSNWLQGRHKV